MDDTYTVKIGGQDREIILLDYTLIKLKKRYNKLTRIWKQSKQLNKDICDITERYNDFRAELDALHKKEAISADDYKAQYKKSIIDEATHIALTKMFIPPSFFYYCCWKVLAKKGVYPFRKPFRSLVHMSKCMRKGERENVIKFISEQVLDFAVKVEEDTKKKG